MAALFRHPPNGNAPMPELKGLQTHLHLKDAFRSESETVHRYLYFAKLADIEGQAEVAQIFREIAEGGTCSAHGNLDFLRLIGDPMTDLPVGETDQNLGVAVAAEMYEYTEFYPEMARIAHAEGFPDIASWFETMTKIKRRHVELLKAALERMENAGRVSK